MSAQAATAEIVDAQKDVLDLLCENHDRAGDLLKQFRDVQRANQKLFAQAISSLQGVGIAPISAPTALPSPTSTGAPPPKHRPAAAAPAPAAAAAKPTGKGGKGAAKGKGKGKGKGAKAASRSPGDNRNYDNELSLRETIWQILDRPENGAGLKVSEIVDIIEKEGVWKSSSPDISNMVQGQVYKLKAEGRLVRGDEKRYYIPEGATLGKEE